MNQQRRHKRLLRLLVEHDTATVPQLVDWLGVSPATIRRDIRLLAGVQMLERAGVRVVLVEPETVHEPSGQKQPH